MADRDYTELYASLQKETTILTAQIRALYRELDKKYHLRGAQIPITFGFETDALGSYTRAGHHEKEHFYFSLLFVGYGVKNPLSKEDRMDLYKLGLKTHQVKNTLIIGGGTISYYLAKALSDLKISVKIIDKNKERCEELSEMLPNATIICGDGTDRALLMEEGLSTVESFVTLTNMDEENIFLSLSAKNMTQAKLIAKVNRLPYKDVIDELDIGSVIYPKYITSDSILRYVRAMQNTIGSNVETLYHVLDNQAEALEFIIRDNSPVVGIPLSKLNLKNNLLVCCLTREGTVRIPRGQDSIQIGDNVIIVTTHKGLRDIRDILA